MMKAYARSHLQFPATTTTTGFARNTVEPFIVAYWACPDNFDSTKTNCKASLVETTVKIGSAVHTIRIPTITNTKPLEEGDAIVVQNSSLGADEPVEEEQPEA